MEKSKLCYCRAGSWALPLNRQFWGETQSHTGNVIYRLLTGQQQGGWGTSLWNTHGPGQAGCRRCCPGQVMWEQWLGPTAGTAATGHRGGPSDSLSPCCRGSVLHLSLWVSAQDSARTRSLPAVGGGWAGKWGDMAVGWCRGTLQARKELGTGQP
jgi:hypothetical protein